MNAKGNQSILKYASTHEWVSAAGGVAVCGITDYAQRQLTDIVFVELPPTGKKLKAGERAAVVESVKSVSDIYAPVSGEVTEVNSRLTDAPELVNSDAFGEGWLFKIALSDEKELDKLMTKEDYDKLIQGEKT
jgi:glycine cleavage system H protein